MARGWVAVAGTAAAGVLAIYPLLLLWLDDRLPRTALAVGFALLVALRLFTGGLRRAEYRWLATVLLGAFCLLVVLDPQLRPLKMYPVLLCVLGSLYCAHTLREGPSAVERLMRRTGFEPTAFQARYMRGVTWLWLVFFALNALVTGWLAVAARFELWAWYTGFASYLIMAVLFIVEYLFRLWYRRREFEEGVP